MVKKVKFHYKAFDAIRKSPAVMDFMADKARDMAAKETGNYNICTFKKRGVIRIFCADKKTARRNLKKNTLVKMARRKS